MDILPQEQTYIAWKWMHRFCYTPSTIRSRMDRGLTLFDIHPAWEDYETFVEDMGYAPPALPLISRFNRDGNFNPENCYWATPEERQSHKRLLLGTRINLDGRILPAGAWERSFGVPYGDILLTKKTFGVSWEEAARLSRGDEDADSL